MQVVCALPQSKPRILCVAVRHPLRQPTQHDLRFTRSCADARVDAEPGHVEQAAIVIDQGRVALPRRNTGSLVLLLEAARGTTAARLPPLPAASRHELHATEHRECNAVRTGRFDLQHSAPAGQRIGPRLVDGEPVFVPGLGIDARAVAAPGEPQVALTWVPS